MILRVRREEKIVGRKEETPRYGYVLLGENHCLFDFETCWPQNHSGPPASASQALRSDGLPYSLWENMRLEMWFHGKSACLKCKNPVLNPQYFINQIL